MSAEAPLSTFSSWRVTLPCTKNEAEALKDQIEAFAELEDPPVLMTSEPDPQAPDVWRLDAYFSGRPTPSDLADLKTLVPSAAGVKAKVEQVEEADWVSISQQGLQPIATERFFVHTPLHADARPEGVFSLEIDAGLAFGTGHHETTTGCLLALERLEATGKRFADVADIGTGTGLLAFAALRLWPTARAIASDIDPIAIEVAQQNAAINRIRFGRGPGQLELVTAAGMTHGRLRRRAPYDLIIANILAGPLIELAPRLAGALAPGGRLILAGLLQHQARRVTAAYRRQGLAPDFVIQRGDWPSLVMRKRRRWRDQGERR